MMIHNMHIYFIVRYLYYIICVYSIVYYHGIVNEARSAQTSVRESMEKPPPFACASLRGWWMGGWVKHGGAPFFPDENQIIKNI